MDREDIIEILSTLDAIPGVSGYEDAIGNKIAEYLVGSVDESHRDVLGNRIFIKHGNNPDLKIMLSAHMDEIGFMVSDITDDGYIIFLPVGHHDPRLLPNQVLTIHTTTGDVPGVTGAGTPPHMQKGQQLASFTFEDFRLDVGAHSRAEAEALGIELGNVITNDRGSRLLRNTFCGKSVDNRAGCAVMIAALQLLKGIHTEATVIGCASVQEELGGKGVQAAANAIAPDIAIALDVCFGAQDESINHQSTRTYLGKGPAIMAYDWSPGSLMGNVVPCRLKDRLVETAKRSGIPYQIQVTLNGGTDAAEIATSNAGVLAGCVSIPSRYVHSVIGTVDIDDVMNSARLLAAFITGIDRLF